MAKGEIYHLGVRSDMVAFLPQRYQRVLEIGCGVGGFRRNLSADCEYWGVEPDTASVQQAQDANIRVLSGVYDEVADQLPDGYFDLVICNDVIEHMPDHDVFLRQIQQKMTADGCLVGSVPNMRYYDVLRELLLQRDWRYRDEGILDRTHLRFFTRISLQRSLAGAGFTLEALQGVNNKLPRPSSLKKLRRYLTIRLLELISLGGYSDIKYMQFGFRVARKS